MTERNGNLLSGLLALSGLMCLAGALIVRQTGDVVYVGDGFASRTHQDAFLVLLVLGLVLLVNTVIVWFHTQQPAPPEQRSDWE